MVPLCRDAMPEDRILIMNTTEKQSRLMFYRAFEDRFRGSRELVSSRLQVYLPFAEFLRKRYPEGAAIDLGCGRGEWLELLAGHGWVATGVDLDEGMLKACVERGLAVQRTDAVTYLKTFPDNSVPLVSAFHLVEHLDFDVLLHMVEEAWRVLSPGGILILETPNPENLTVGTANFYLDPTHQRPIPPPLLSFVVEYSGFLRNKVMRLQEDPATAAKDSPDLINVLSGVSPDYAVVAQKDGESTFVSLADALFAKEYGLTMDVLAERYDQSRTASEKELEVRAQESERRAEHLTLMLERAETKILQAEFSARQCDLKAKDAEKRVLQAEQLTLHAEVWAQRAESRAEQTETRAQQAESRAQQAESRAQTAEGRVAAIELESRLNVEQLGLRLADAESQLGSSRRQVAELSERNAAFLSSTSWRVTAPLRLAKDLVVGRAAQAGRESSGALRYVKTLARPLAVRMAGLVLRNKGLTAYLSATLQRFPAFRSRLVQFARNANLVRAANQVTPSPEHGVVATPEQASWQVLTRRAKSIKEKIDSANASVQSGDH